MRKVGKVAIVTGAVGIAVTAFMALTWFGEPTSSRLICDMLGWSRLCK